MLMDYSSSSSSSFHHHHHHHHHPASASSDLSTQSDPANRVVLIDGRQHSQNQDWYKIEDLGQLSFSAQPPLDPRSNPHSAATSAALPLAWHPTTGLPQSAPARALNIFPVHHENSDARQIQYQQSNFGAPLWPGHAAVSQTQDSASLPRQVITPPLSDKSVRMSPQMRGNVIPLKSSTIDNRQGARRSLHRANTTASDSASARRTNAKIDIEAGFTIETADSLIAEAQRAGDEELVLKRKHQKRLLRNRTAALFSRERRKKHTIELETSTSELKAQIARLTERNKLLTDQIKSLEVGGDLASAHQQIRDLQQECENLRQYHVMPGTDMHRRLSDPSDGRASHHTTLSATDTLGDSSGYVGSPVGVDAVNSWADDFFGLARCVDSDDMTALNDSRHVPNMASIAASGKQVEYISGDVVTALLLLGAVTATKDQKHGSPMSHLTLQHGAIIVGEALSKLSGTSMTESGNTSLRCIEPRILAALQELCRGDAGQRARQLIDGWQ